MSQPIYYYNTTWEHVPFHIKTKVIITMTSHIIPTGCNSTFLILKMLNKKTGSVNRNIQAVIITQSV